MKIRVGIISNSSWNIYNFRMHLINRLMEEGYQPVVFAPVDNFTPMLKSMGLEFIPIRHLNRSSLNIFKELQLCKELRRHFAIYKVQVLLSFTIKPNIYASLVIKKASTQTICTVTGLGYTFINDNLISKFIRILYKYAFHRCQMVFFQNSMDRALFLENKLISKTKALLVPGSGIDTDYYSPNKYDQDDSTFRFLFIGRLLADKGINEFLEAAEMILEDERHQSIEFQIIGQLDKGNPASINQETLNYYINQYPQIKFVGQVDDVRDYIIASTSLVLPSYREGLPRVILEAMAMEKPVIATNVPGCNELVNHEVNGYLCRVKDPYSLRDSILRMYHTAEEQRREMGRKGRNLIVGKYDEKHVADIYVDAIEHLISDQ